MGPTNNNKSTRPGERLSDGLAHQQDHSRRNFLRNLGIIGTSGFLLNKIPVNALGMSPLMAALAGADDDRVLVMIRLKGGNDGLNTLIPIHDFGTYQRHRPDIFVPRNEVVDLTSTLGLHPQLAPLRSLWNEGQMRVVQNVGYPGQNLSHFRSSDIWATASDSEEVINSGVLGRYLSIQHPDFLSMPPATPPAIQIGGPGNLLFNNADDFNYAISTENPTQLYQIARTGQLYDVNDVPDCTYGEQLSYLRAVANTTFRYAGVLAQAYDAGENSAEYRNDRLGDQLSLVARMLRGGLGTRFFVVELDGFDTHANQVRDHGYLLQSVAENVTAFFADLKAGAIDDRVLAMTFSEFGRRIFQNGSAGTDHGAAAPLLLFGKGLNGNGMTGGLPDMNDVDNNDNMKFQVDFRNVYATVLSNWLCIDGDLVDNIMGAPFERMSDLGLFCQGTTSTRNRNTTELPFKAYLSGGEVVLEYDLPTSSRVAVHFFDVSGKKLSAPYSGQQLAGGHVQRFALNSVGWASGLYVVSLEVNGKMHSRKLGVFR
ncbi:DUF1501 domain-containing protein [Neolewinella lacunae]|uniref:DUF1501 domain-containing protein n=1 Tax=Neolewinella lacunae TaxID=1517758 RepID=A0A923T6R3_9BACT|nr:DUF1501 domain-containing protein [Neolewinella lacunae]MBC6992769.1 DUF1501 domain-containing protein [Neolewinella lacunae]MDN3636013.1 DUF1501 domain-containing protein [Neolewinella lacunae]